MTSSAPTPQPRKPRRSPLQPEPAAAGWHTVAGLGVLVVGAVFPLLLGQLAQVGWGKPVALGVLVLMMLVTATLFVVDKTWRRWAALMGLALPTLGLLAALLLRNTNGL